MMIFLVSWVLYVVVMVFYSNAPSSGAHIFIALILPAVEVAKWFTNEIQKRMWEFCNNIRLVGDWSGKINNEERV